MRASDEQNIVLVVDDEKLMCGLMARILSTKYSLLVASDVSHALALARSFPGGIDLLITDVQLGDGGGVNLATTLRNERPGMCALLMSGYRDFILPEGLHFLEKPFSPRDLLSVTARLLA